MTSINPRDVGGRVRGRGAAGVFPGRGAGTRAFARARW